MTEVNLIPNLDVLHQNYDINPNDYPIYTLEKEKESNYYSIFLTPDLFICNKKINFVNEENNNIATISINDQIVNLDSNEDIILIGYDFSDFDFIIRSVKNIIFKGTMILNTLDINSLNFSFQNLTTNNLMIKVSEKLLGVGILNVQNSTSFSELDANCIILNQDTRRNLQVK